MAFSRPEPIRGKHDAEGFTCGERALDDWLHRHARHAEAAGTARTFVTMDGERLVGYYALTLGQVQPGDATERLLKGQPSKRPVPVLLLARLAVDRHYQGQRVGTSLLQDALLRCAAAAEIVGGRAVVAHANEHASTFYDRFGFEASPTDPLHRILLMKDLRRFISGLEDG
ncbi:MAG TPA: GNAT family N-acetyltransferase [Solirubrobacterales bacterium]|nr:GNAT family N-acetyltransferase [Solirubrobacterales bacterium]